MYRRFAKFCAVPLVALSLAGCESINDVTRETLNPPGFSYPTRQNIMLRNAPAPSHRIRVSVYDFPDLTGQYEEPENVQSLSRAVSQGGAPMLIKALQDAGERRWFTVLDRSGLESLVRERQIITEMRRIYRNEQNIDPSALGPLAHAGIIVQGGIIGYDSNIVTGGYGARYLGIGGDKQYKVDVVTVSLRAVSTETGEVLASVVARKPIASVSNRGSIFSYVALDELLEAETGYALNEPRQIAVEQAIEKAVLGLIAEGAQLGVWSFADPAAGQEFVSNYQLEKYRGTTGTSGRALPPVETRDAARVVQTRPVARQAPPRVIERVVTRPAPQAQEPSPPPPPPPAGEGETVG